MPFGQLTRAEALSGVGKGWHNIVGLLVTALPPKARIQQVKEKFGGLRFYWTSTATLTEEEMEEEERFLQCVYLVEGLSYFICEECGEIGWPCRSANFWIRTLCQKHMQEAGYTRQEEECTHSNAICTNCNSTVQPDWSCNCDNPNPICTNCNETLGGGQA